MSSPAQDFHVAFTQCAFNVVQYLPDDEQAHFVETVTQTSRRWYSFNYVQMCQIIDELGRLYDRLGIEVPPRASR